MSGLRLPLFGILMLSFMIGCGGGSDNSSAEESSSVTVENIRFYGDAKDARIVSFESSGKQLTFFGLKNADGMPQSIERLHLVDGGDEYTIFYNEYGLPSKSIDHGDGSIAGFEYDTSLATAGSGIAAGVAINAVYTHLIRRSAEGVERQLEKTSVTPQNYAAISAPEVDTGNVQIDVKHCDAEAPAITNVRLSYYYWGGKEYWVDARPSEIVAGRYFATLPEYENPDSGMSLADVCAYADQAISLTCQAGELHTQVMSTCYMLAVSPEAPISIPACTAAFSAYELYCLTAPDGTGPGTSLGEFTCEQIADFEEYIDPGEKTMEVQAYIYQDGDFPGADNAVTVHTSEIKTIPLYGAKELYFDVYLEEPTFSGFALTPRPSRITDDFTVAADFQCVQDALLQLTVENSGAPDLMETVYALTPNVSAALDVSGRSPSDNQDDYDSSLITAVASRSGNVLLQDRMVLLWKKPADTSASLPVVTLLASNATMTEPSGTGSFTIYRTGDTDVPLQVYFTIGGSASINDYLIENIDHSQSITIPAGDESATITVTTLDDDISEDPETIVMTLIADSFYNVGSAGTATIQIYDNDSEIVTGAGSLSGDFNATCSDGYSDGSNFSIHIAADGSITGTYDWGGISGSVDNRAVSLELDGDWSDCSMEGTLSGSGTELTGSGDVYCSGSDCHGTWQATHGG